MDSLPSFLSVLNQASFGPPPGGRFLLLTWIPVALFSFCSKTEALIFEKKIKKYDHKRLIALINSDKNILDSFLSNNENLLG
ncbi:MAG: hypothetical protein IPH36_20945 [Saprospiraceae bacterium]|nr:hypothetical protein [Saprospiraceae bacterium]